MTLRQTLFSTAVIRVAESPVISEIAAFGSTRCGGTNQIVRVVSAMILENSDIQMRPQEPIHTADDLPLDNVIGMPMSNFLRIRNAFAEGLQIPPLSVGPVSAVGWIGWTC